MFLANDIRWDEKIEDPQEMIAAIKEGKAVFNLYLICVNDKGKIQIMSCYQAFKQVNAPDSLTVIAAAKGKQNAFDLFTRLISEWISEHGDIKGFADHYK